MSGLLAGPLKDIQRLVPKPLLRSLGCVLGVVVLLEDEPSPQFEVLSALQQVFIKDLSICCAIHLPSILTSLPVPPAEKHIHMLHHMDGIGHVMSGAWFPFIRLENLVSHGLRVL